MKKNKSFVLFSPLLCMVFLPPVVQSQAQVLRRPLPEKLVVLTFDDAVKSHYTFVAPLLKKYGFGATFFVCEFVSPPFSDTSLYMNWNQIRQLNRMGFEIGNHTGQHQHVNKGTLQQLEAAVAYIERKCDSLQVPPPVSFAYPGYDTAARAAALLRKKGYRFARTGGGRPYNPSADDPLYLPSFSTAGNDSTRILNALRLAGKGKIIVLTVHGVPDTAHPWVNTPPALFQQYMEYLYQNGYTVVAMRQLDNYLLQ